MKLYGVAINHANSNMSIAFAHWWRMFSPIWTAILPPIPPCFESTTRSVAEAAKSYLHGLYQSTRANMERMVDVVAGSHPQRLHHMLSESTWDHAGVLRQLVADANEKSKGSASYILQIEHSLPCWRGLACIALKSWPASRPRFAS